MQKEGNSLVQHEVQAKCIVRTRIPTPHGPAFLHLYHNNHDSKEHLAIVIDPAQLSESLTPMVAPAICSASLDAIWNDSESFLDRLIRGAYTGRLTSDILGPSSSSSNLTAVLPDIPIPSPLVRIHSECYTGETIGSMRCDCGEQLDEAMRQIALPTTVVSASGTSHTIPGRGVIIYMRQEGRGIGLASKLRAYNLQDMGHDTVAANLLLGHGADERGYEVAGAILRDLRLSDTIKATGIRLLTNNPTKVKSLTAEGVRITERVPMVPRSWQSNGLEAHQHGHENLRRAGSTLIGGDAVSGEELDKYIKTKVKKMGHMLPIPASL
ncbi:GTP cyclohydrolase II-domain-containing protein [Mycena crocata]|nr:GTP cyclohydrolase II-domain-containing protein [Mycena crocata]